MISRCGGENGYNKLSSAMILGNPAELRDAVPLGMRLMGLDVGTKTIGLALSDTRCVIALPLTLAGGDGRRTQSVRQFARNLVALRDLPVALWDERLSTAAVTREMISADLTRKRRAQIVDRVAAAYILQGCLDFLGRPSC